MDKKVSITNHDVLDGEPKIHVDRNPSIKIATSPKIVVAIPCGDKHEASALSCPTSHGGCGLSWLTPGVRQPNLIPVQLMLAHMNMVQPLNCAMTYMVESGRLSAEARQVMTKKALRLGAEYILYWDDDTLPPPLGLYTLNNWMDRHPEAGAITGIYTTRETPNEPLVYTEHGKGAAWEIPIGPGAEPVPIFGAGAGFLLARLSAIEDTIAQMTEENGGQEVPIWADERTLAIDSEDVSKVIDRPSMWGHDVRFCKVLTEHGWPVYAHGEVLCAHLDIPTQKLFTMPADSPGWTTKPNTAPYWDLIYGKEGPNTWRQYPEMFQKVVDEVTPGSTVVELGCGVGILGSKLTAEKGARWHGYDISQVAVDMATARFLDAEQLDIANNVDLVEFKADVVIATEFMEHIDAGAFAEVVSNALTHADKLVFTVPDNCMGPDEVPEHTALFNEELVRDRLQMCTDAGYTLRIDKADTQHLICIVEK